MRLTELAHYTGLTSGSMITKLDRLEKARFIRRKTTPEDRRSVLIEITQEWTETAGPLVRGVQQAHARLIASYTDKELETIADFLTRFTGNVLESIQAFEQD